MESVAGGLGGAPPPLVDDYSLGGKFHQMFREAFGRGAAEQSIRNMLPMLREAHFEPHPTAWGAWLFGPLEPNKKWHNMWRFFTAKMMVDPDLHDLSKLAGNKKFSKGPKDMKLAWTFKDFVHTVGAASVATPTMEIPERLRARVTAAEEVIKQRPRGGAGGGAANSSARTRKPKRSSQGEHKESDDDAPGSDDSEDKDEIEDDSGDSSDGDAPAEDDDDDDGADIDFIVEDEKPAAVDPEPKRAKLSTTQ